jgi:hypothetical protein
MKDDQYIKQYICLQLFCYLSHKDNLFIVFNVYLKLKFDQLILFSQYMREI